ncbi:MAG: nucleotidyltransferase family protein [Azoarcus sp.]|nr:nucleotidyltransferase family protein [Azoarcus sp.]
MKRSAALEKNRERIRKIVLAHLASNPRVFGSVLHGDDTELSDLDILIDPAHDASLLDIANIQVELGALLGVSIDVLTPTALPPRLRTQVVQEAQAI